MKKKYLFLGGSRDGEMLGVRSGQCSVEVPVYDGGKALPLDGVVKPDDTFPIETYIKVSAPTDSGVKVVFATHGMKVAELHRLINRPVHAIIK